MYDFANELPGVNLGGLVASRQYGLILGLIDLLPYGSKVRAAMEQDEEYVEMVREAILAEPDKKEEPPVGPSPAEWSALHGVLADLIDEVRVLGEKVIAAGGGKPSEPKPYTRPKTAMTLMAQSVRMEKRKARHERLVRQLVPDPE